MDRESNRGKDLPERKPRGADSFGDGELEASWAGSVEVELDAGFAKIKTILRVSRGSVPMLLAGFAGIIGLAWHGATSVETAGIVLIVAINSVAFLVQPRDAEEEDGGTGSHVPRRHEDDEGQTRSPPGRD